MRGVLEVAVFAGIVGLTCGCTAQEAARVVDAGVPTQQGPDESGPPATKLGAQLATIGLDITNLPPLSAIPPQKLLVVMQAFETSLGAQCSDCHTLDFTQDTPRKLVAEKMWDDFVRQLNRKNGSALFCDSCHAGKMTFLDRTNDVRLATWMNANYVGGLSRKDGTEQTCASCHGTPFDPNFLGGWEASADGGIDAGDGGMPGDLATPHDLSTSPDLGACKPSVNEVQVAGAGGSSDEFVELFNPCSTPYNLTSHRLVYRSASGTSDIVLVSLDGQTLAAGGFLVVGNAAYTGTATLRYSSSLANTSGGVALEDSADHMIDDVAWGSATNAFVQGKPAASPPASKSVARIPDGSHAHGDQSLDLVVGTPTPGASN